MPPIEEFRPPLRRRRARVALGVLFTLVGLVGAALLLLFAAGSGEITYRVRSGTLEVRSGSLLDGSRSFALSDIVSAEEAELGRGRRVRGTAAPGVCTGIYWYERLGQVWQATDCSSHLVVLRVRGEERPILMTPPEPQALLGAIEAGTDVAVALPPGESAWLLRLVPGALGLVLLGVTGVLLLAFACGPEHMRYRVVDGTLEVRTILTRRAFVARELTVRRHTPARVFRLAGSALPGYYTGLYRADGSNTHFYATRLDSGVLVQGPRRLFLTPEDPDAFVDALRAAGSRVEAAPPGPSER